MDYATDQHPPSEFCNTEAAAAFIGFSPRTLEEWRAANCGPRYYKVGRHIRYTYADLREWVLSSPSEP